jgi:molybdate transport system substrate-binding protein
VNDGPALNVLCAGAVKGLVVALQSGFEAASGLRLRARFGAVGAMRDALRTGAPCDVFVATAAMLEALQASGDVRAGSVRAIGRVQTAIAVRAGAPLPAIDTAASLEAALRGASALYFPDATQSTAGAHVASILEHLGLSDVLAPRLRMFANGATAMGELAGGGDEAALGCTQATEIRYTPGLVLVGPLPPPFALATVYAAGVPAEASDAAHAGDLIEQLAGAKGAALRRAGGFDANDNDKAPRVAP